MTTAAAMSTNGSRNSHIPYGFARSSQGTPAPSRQNTGDVSTLQKSATVKGLSIEPGASNIMNDIAAAIAAGTAAKIQKIVATHHSALFNQPPAIRAPPRSRSVASFAKRLKMSAAP